MTLDNARRRLEIALQSGDIARMQATLDVVDTRLGRVPAPVVLTRAVVRGLSVLTMFATLALGQFAALLASWLAFAQPGAALMAASGAASVAAGVLTWRDDPLWVTLETQSWIAVALLSCGLVMCATAFANRREPPGSSKLVSFLAFCTAVAWSVLMFQGSDIVGVHQGARDFPGVAVLSMALAAALAFGSRRFTRLASVPVAAAGFIAVFAGSTLFLDWFGRDPFLAQAPPATWRTISGSAVSNLPMPFFASDLRLSPDGAYLAVLGRNSEGHAIVHAGPVGGPLAEFYADEAIFIADVRLMLVDRQRQKTHLRLVALDSGNREAWVLRLPIVRPAVSFDRATEAWRLLGRNQAGEIVSISGHASSQAVQEQRWKPPADDEDEALVVAAVRGDALALETRAQSGWFGLEPYRHWTALLAPRPRIDSRLWKLHAGVHAPIARSRLEVSCDGILVDGERTLCSAFDGTRTRLFGVHPETRQLTPLASMTGRFYVRGDAGNGWVTGWWNRSAVVLRAATGQGMKVAERRDKPVVQLAVADGVLGAVSHSMGVSTVHLYRLE